MTCDEKYKFLLQEVIKALAFESRDYPSPTDIKANHMYIYRNVHLKEKKVRLLEGLVYLL